MKIIRRENPYYLLVDSNLYLGSMANRLKRVVYFCPGCFSCQWDSRFPRTSSGMLNSDPSLAGIIAPEESNDSMSKPTLVGTGFTRSMALKGTHRYRVH